MKVLIDDSIQKTFIPNQKVLLIVAIIIIVATACIIFINKNTD